ncbi:MAG TPA: class I SAM-dependent methyltransferase [Caulobacteraceae bacterium]|nr:class I SAM-dependent methyltransferase [Caulobacteraceae bacterium]
MTGPTSPRYGLHADRYRRFRPSYPGWIFDEATQACGMPRSRAAELGAGSGQATPEILKRFAHVIAVEPDPDMASRIPPDIRLEVRVSPAETVVFDKPLDAVFSATAFHWMDPVAVGKKVATALRPGGVFLAFGYAPFEVLGPMTARLLVDHEMRLWSPHIDPRLTQWKPYPELMAASGAFSQIEPIAFEFTEERAPEAAAGLFLTTSYAGQYARDTSNEQAYCDDFSWRMSQAAQGGPIEVRFCVTGALARV